MRFGLACSLLLALLACRSESRQASFPPAAAADPAYAGVQARGEVAMGVNQYTSSHVFDALADGGRIELQRDAEDSAGTARIREHMQQIATRFAAGDFRLPGYVHNRTVPGTRVMAAKRSVIVYDVESLPHGAALRVRSDDPGAVQAIHAFLAFQRQDHHAANRDS